MSRLDATWLAAELVAYFKLYDHEQVWTERGARALADWLVTRLEMRPAQAFPAELWQAAEDVVLQEGRNRLGIGFSTIPSGAIDRLRRALEASR